MSPNRFAKSLLRRLRVSWREQPTQHDIEALAGNIARVGLVIRMRWLIVAAIITFSVVGGAIYLADTSVDMPRIVGNMLIPGATLLFVLAYNTYYQLTYRALGNIAVLNHAQLMFDSLVISVLVHYSGGVYSWFYPMYALLVLEAAFIFSRRRDTWIVALTAAALYASVLWLEYWRVLPHVDMPFVAQGLQLIAAYVAVHALWNLTLVCGTALISIAMMERIRTREAQLEAASPVDEATGLSNRHHFTRRLGQELQRAQVYGRSLSVLLLDIDAFGEFNGRFGMEAGNRMLAALAELLEDEVLHASGSPVAEFCTVARYGGEEFGVVLPQAPGLSGEEQNAMTLALAERLRDRVGHLRVDDMGVTVSIGMAVFPEDGQTASDLVASADQALFGALALGGNRVVSSADDFDLGSTG